MLSLAAHVLHHLSTPQLRRRVRGSPPLALLRSSVPQEVAEALDKLETSPQHPWTVHQLARSASLSTSQLTRILKKTLGITPSALIWRTRLDRMAYLLTAHSMTVSEAAEQTGWSSRTAAARAFKRRYAVCPATYARHARQLPLRT
ncbi:helix-turn-helix transcriptional regulator [Microbacterium sp. SORGH_AS_0862]|uniref:helix-turn-helix transcriptional regulator n=1 Tax=Microbacterium sp. SORGH_AS_0862 TaxID=3041789 RepID=UPI003593461F